MAIFLKTVHQHLRGEHKSNGYLQSSRHLVLSKKLVFFMMSHPTTGIFMWLVA